MRFMLIIHHSEAAWVTPSLVRDIEDWVDALKQDGRYITGGAMEPAGLANTITRNEKNEIVRHEGPLHDHPIVFAAFELISCKSAQEAEDIARTHPAFIYDDTVIEVRRMWDEMHGEMLRKPSSD
ncbi:YciI family protein [Ponticaulis profundi]|uniref:YciI family protein n=1 Tax=Ponticaulis profundi TaxID=2665222 RepID=A0ABW1S4T2_9PROT